VANAQSTVELIFQGVDRTAAATQSALENLGRVSGGVKDITQPIADFSIGALKLEAGILATGAALTTFAVYKAAEFEGAVLDLQKVMSETDGPIARFKEAAKDIGLEYGTSATEVLASAANFRQAGFTTEEAFQLVRNALDLKIAGDIEAARGSDLLVASLKGFNLEASEASRIVDLLNAVSNEYATDVNELATGFALLSPVAKAAGLSLEETAGILTPGIEVFRSGSEVANGLRTVLLRLQDDSKPVQEALASLGVTQKDANGELRSARDIYFDVAQAFGGLSDSQKTFTAAQLAGLDQSAKFLAVTDGLGKTLQIAGGGFEYLGSAAKEVEIRLGSADFAINKTKVAVENLLVEIGTPLLDEFGGIADAIANIFAALGASVRDGKLGGLVDYIGSVMSEIQTALEAVARNLPAALEKADLGRFQEGIKSVIDAFKTLFNNIDLTTVDGLAAGINLAGTAFLGLSKYVAGVIESFKPLFDQLVKVGSGLQGVNTDIFKTLGEIGGFITQLNLLSGAVAALATVLTAKQLIELFGGLKNGIQLAALAAPALTAALGPAALAGAALYAGTQVTKLVEAFLEWKRARDLVVEAENRGIAIQEKAIPSLEKFAVTTGFAVKSLDEADDLINKGLVVWDKASGTWLEASKAQAAMAAAAASSLNPFAEQNALLLAGAKYGADAAKATGSLAYAQAGLLDEGIKIVPFYDKVTGQLLGYERASADASEATKNLGTNQGQTAKALELTAEQAQRAAIEAAKVGVELEKIASNERIKLIEARVALNIAGLEADTKRVQSAFESINVGIQSTGDLLGSLFGNLTDSNYFSSAGSEIRRQISRENERRDQEFELQKELVEAQIDRLKEQTRRMQNGDALIKIEGDGLKPHLEAFMWEILRSIQVRVNQDGLDLLVGA
jgi:TP901 family phage tail tape measure protein